MRPQHIAAEYWVHYEHSHELRPASMRPQHIAAEYHYAFDHNLLTPPASMRPQHIAAEYYFDEAAHYQKILSFNEAAAYRCGIQRRRTAFIKAELKLQ